MESIDIVGPPKRGLAIRARGLGSLIALAASLSLAGSVAASVTESLLFADQPEIAPANGGTGTEVALSLSASVSGEVTWNFDLVGTLGWNSQFVDQVGAPAGTHASRTTCPACTTTLTVLLQPEEEAITTDNVVIELRYRDQSARLSSSIERIYLHRDAAGTMRLSSSAEHEAAHPLELINGIGVSTGDGLVREASESLRSAAPWENPEVPAAIAARFKAELETSNLDTATLPQTTRPGPASGACGAGNPSGVAWGIGVFLLLFMAIRHRRRSAPSRGVSSVLCAALMLASVPSYAVSITAYGLLAFWDSRPDQSADTGSRIPLCDDTDTTCTPQSTGDDCCFRGIPGVTVYLIRSGMQVDMYETTSDGWYLLTDTSGVAGTYSLLVVYDRDGYPAKMKATNEAGALIGAAPPAFALAAGYNYIPIVSVTTAGDTSSSTGDYATAWRSTFEMFDAFETEGETRHRAAFGSMNPYDLITMRYMSTTNPPTSYAGCGSNRIDMKPSHMRGWYPAHELGHILHGRVVGCAGGSGNLPAFPTYRVGAGSWWTSEGNSLGETTSELAANLWHWDPDTVSTSDMMNGWMACASGGAETPDNFSNTNDLSANRNNMYGLWEFLDTDTSNTDIYGDYIDLSLPDLFDGLVQLQNTAGSTGQNRTANERSGEIATLTSCSDPDDCANGDVCYLDGLCWTNDPHGSNLRDWIAHLATTSGESETDLWTTMVSSTCIGPADDTSPFTGGYHSD
jgi:hypothetical protein